MSAAANAAGYLYARGQLPTESSPHTAKSVPSQGQSEPLKQVRTPRIEYRKRRSYLLPSAASLGR
jgi:hypothetical protein